MKTVWRYRRRLALLTGSGLAGLAVGGMLDVGRTQHVFISTLRNSDNVYDWTSGIHYGEEMIGFYLSYLALLLVAALIGGAGLLTPAGSGARNGGWSARFAPFKLVIVTTLVGSIALGMVANRYRTERFFEQSGISSSVSKPSVLDPWHGSASFYPQLILFVACGVVLLWGLWLLLAGWLARPLRAG